MLQVITNQDPTCGIRWGIGFSRQVEDTSTGITLIVSFKSVGKTLNQLSNEMVMTSEVSLVRGNQVSE